MQLLKTLLSQKTFFLTHKHALKMKSFASFNTRVVFLRLANPISKALLSFLTLKPMIAL